MKLQQQQNDAYDALNFIQQRMDCCLDSSNSTIHMTTLNKKQQLKFKICLTKSITLQQ